jgi:PAS domain-containing protein
LLHQLAEKIQESENDFRLLTDSLPLMMFSVNPNGAITYSNKWLQGFFGTIPKELTSKSWKEFIHEQDYNFFSKDLNNALALRRNTKRRSSGYFSAFIRAISFLALGLVYRSVNVLLNCITAPLVPLRKSANSPFLR